MRESISLQEMPMRILKSSLLVLAACGLAILALVLRAKNASKAYLIVANGQSPSSTAAVAALAASRGTVTATFDDIGIVAASSSDPDFAAVLSADGAVQSVSEDPQIQWLPNETVVAADVDQFSLPPANAETFSAEQWNLRAIHADATAANGDRGNSATRARVAVLDSGIVTNHIDIAANLNLALSKSFVPTEPNLNPPPGFNHGTHVAGIIAAPVNGKGVQGVAPDAEIVAVKVLSAAGSRPVAV